MTGKDGFLERMIKSVLESMLGKEFDDFIGRERHEHTDESGKSYRNRSYPKAVKTSFDDITVN